MKPSDARGLVTVVVAIGAIGIALALAMSSLDDAAVDLGPPPSEDLVERASAGDADACFGLAEHYRLGRGVVANGRTAMRWYECAARSGHAGARYQMGRLFETGDGVRQDFKRAAELYRLATDLGRFPAAQYALGQLHYSGRGVANDYGLAIQWFRRAADGDYAPAQHVLGTIYEHGWGVDSDLIAAYAWYTLAMRRASDVREADPTFDPGVSRARLAAKMNRFETEKAQQRARNWRPRR